jgi:hypothetical protein
MIPAALKSTVWQKYLPRGLSINPSKRGKLSGSTAVVYWDREKVSFLVARHKTQQTFLQRWGSTPHLDYPNPFAALSAHFAAQQIETNQLLVLLSRSDVDVLAISLPKSDAAELPAMVLAEVEQHLGESESLPIVDYFCLPEDRASNLRNDGLEDEPNSQEHLQNLLAFSLNPNKLAQMRQQATQAGFRLAAVGFRQLSTLNQLSRLKVLLTGHLNVSLQVYQGEVELAVFAGKCPLILRSVRVNLDDIYRVAEQLVMEVDRCTTLLPPEHENIPRRWLVDGCSESGRALAQAMADHLQSSVVFIEGHSSMADQEVLAGYQIVQIEATKGLSSEPINEESDLPEENPADANVSGTGEIGPGIALGGSILDYYECDLPVDLVNPKRPPVPPNPWIRTALLSAAGIFSLAVIGWVLLSDVWKLQDEVRSLESRLSEAAKLLAKSQEKADQVQTIEQWLSDQVDWLTALSEVSQRLPDGKNATVRRLTASTTGSEGVFDLSVQVRQPEDISVLESQLRSVKYSVASKRISQAPEASEYPWRFETRIAFPIEPLSWSLFGSPITETELVTAREKEIDQPKDNFSYEEELR